MKEDARILLEKKKKGGWCCSQDASLDSSEREVKKSLGFARVV